MLYGILGMSGLAGGTPTACFATDGAWGGTLINNACGGGMKIGYQFEGLHYPSSRYANNTVHSCHLGIELKGSISAPLRDTTMWQA